MNDLSQKFISQKNSRLLTSEVKYFFLTKLSSSKVFEELVDEGIISQHEFCKVFDAFFDDYINL